MLHVYYDIGEKGSRPVCVRGMIITRAPLRVSLFGGGTDYKAYYEKHGGAFISMAIDKYVYILVKSLPPYFSHNIRLSYSSQEQVVHARNIKHNVIRASLDYMGISGDIEMTTMADLPARTGLGSGSSFTVALLHALHTYKVEGVTETKLAQEAIHIERDILGQAVGVQDQHAAAFGWLRRYDIESDGSVRCKPIARKGLLNHCLMFFTGFQRDAYAIAADWIARTEINEKALIQIQAYVNEAETYMALEDYKRLGRIMNESWGLKRGLSPMIPTPFIDSIHAAAMEAGAWGGKLLGAGGGGFMLFIAPPERHQDITNRLGHRLRPVKFDVAQTGSEVLFNLDGR